MLRKILFLNLIAVLLVSCSLGDAAQKEKKKTKRTGTLVGEVKSTKSTPNKKNVIIEVLAPGEEKARSYFVAINQSKKGTLEAVRSAKVGDRVQLEWVDTGEGLGIIAFQLLKKKAADK